MVFSVACFDVIVQKPVQNIKLEKQFRSTPSTEKV